METIRKRLARSHDIARMELEKLLKSQGYEYSHEAGRIQSHRQAFCYQHPTEPPVYLVCCRLGGSPYWAIEKEWN